MDWLARSVDTPYLNATLGRCTCRLLGCLRFLLGLPCSSFIPAEHLAGFVNGSVKTLEFLQHGCTIFVILCHLLQSLPLKLLPHLG
jgi:hypothetical protein